MVETNACSTCNQPLKELSSNGACNACAARNSGAEEVQLVGTHKPRFRGDNAVGLVVGWVWAFVFGGIVIFMSTSAPSPLFPLAMAGIIWVWGVFLLRRWLILRDGTVIVLGPDGFAIAPRSQGLGKRQPWRSGLEITFTQERGAWRLNIVDGLSNLAAIILPGQSDSDVESIREKLARWQPNRVFVEKL